MIQLDAMNSFVAIDFETANSQRVSACAVGLARGGKGKIEVVRSFLIRPPASQFVFTGIHGLRWEDVRAAPTFGELWPTLHAWIDNAEFIAAHNAPFDSSVLHSCCAITYGIRVPKIAIHLHGTVGPLAVGNLPDEVARCLPPASHPSTSPRRGVRRGSVCAHRACCQG